MECFLHKNTLGEGLTESGGAVGGGGYGLLDSEPARVTRFVAHMNYSPEFDNFFTKSSYFGLGER